MGKLRLDTLTRLLASSEDHEAIKQNYVDKKLEKLKVKHKDLDQEDLFCIRDALKNTLQARYQDAVILKTKHFADKGPEQAVLDSAKASEDLGKIFQSIVAFELSTSCDEKTRAFEKIMRILSSNRDPLIQTAATQSLLRLERTAKNSKELHEFITRPLAIAIGMPFNGLPMCPKHREKIEHFIDTNFDGLLRHLGSAVKEELGVQKRFKTSAIMSAIRIRRT